jgi:hypothetical protein
MNLFNRTEMPFIGDWVTWNGYKSEEESGAKGGRVEQVHDVYVLVSVKGDNGGVRFYSVDYHSITRVIRLS